MRVSIEWFLLDNLVMNYLVFALAGTLLGTRVRFGRSLLCSLFGSAYALLSLSVLPVLQSLWCKAILMALFALPLYYAKRSYLWSLACVFISAFLMGGLMTFLTLLMGGTMSKNGTLTGTLPIRAALLGFFLCATLPRLMRSVVRRRSLKRSRVRLRLTLETGEWSGEGLIDSGNLIVEPVTGLPVIFVSRPVKGTVPILMSMAGGERIIRAERAKRVMVNLGVWQSVDAFVASAPMKINEGEAIVPLVLLSEDWRDQDDKKVFNVAVFKALFEKGKVAVVHTFGRNAAAAARGRRGASMHSKKQDGQGRKGQAHRAQSETGGVHSTQV